MTEAADSYVVHAADADGVYVGLVSVDQAVQRTDSAPPLFPGPWCWTNGEWARLRTLDAAKLEGAGIIDAAAGAARLRYITDVPGQQDTYILKAEQAHAYLDNLNGTVPPFVQAESDATGMSPVDAANLIIAAEHEWCDILGPAVERERRRGKVAVDAATTLDAVDFAVSAALMALGSI
jgi:hypothetical protein